MIVDTSALLAIAFDEPDQSRMVQALKVAETRRMSAGNWLEMFIVVETKRWVAAVARLETFLFELELDVVAVTFEQAQVARQAYARFGRGNHPARLNYGDCFAYALAKTTGDTLLFKGSDFGQTDVKPALVD